MDSGWVTAAFGLGGVVVGGVVNARVAAWADRRARRNASRSASRLVAEEIQLLQNLVKASITTGIYGPSVDGGGLPTTEWQLNRQVLAGLEVETWRAVSEVYSAVAHLEIVLALNDPPPQAGGTVSDADQPGYKRLSTVCETALAKLQPIISR